MTGNCPRGPVFVDVGRVSVCRLDLSGTGPQDGPSHRGRGSDTPLPQSETLGFRCGPGKGMASTGQ